jgi:hypothetical protein
MITHEKLVKAHNDTVAEIDNLLSAGSILAETGEVARVSSDKLLAQFMEDLRNIRSIISAGL